MGISGLSDFSALPAKKAKTSGENYLLIRWNDPEHGVIQPLEFIPTLEDTGMILAVGGWAICKALMDRCEWIAQGVHSSCVECDEMQGFLFSKPVPVEQLSALYAVHAMRAASRETGPND